MSLEAFFDTPSADDYLKSIDNWQDPNPKPVLKDHEGFIVVRDDLLGAGSKIRGVDYLIGHNSNTKDIEEWVFGSCPANGYAQISLPVVCERYGKKAVLFMAERKRENLHEYQLRGLSLKAEYHWVPNGMLPVTQKRAKDYAAEHPDKRALLPLGLEHETVIGSFIKVARDLPIQPKEVWTVGSSGTLNRSLQLAWPDAEVHVVSVGHTMKEREIGRAIYHRSELKFDKPVKPEDAPPFPCAPTYDAKAWKFMRELASPGALFWNVGA
tara:strand:+ start:933 stop:1736 length:804 start_codon:yes stop_codon:yes gene_type:complete